MTDATPKCHYCNDTGMVAIRSRDGQYAFAGPVPDDAKGYTDADCWYCDSGRPPMRKIFDIATDVTLECPCCRQYQTVDRTPELPPNVRLIEIICPACDDGDRHAETWFSAPGVVVSQDDRIYND